MFFLICVFQMYYLIFNITWLLFLCYVANENIPGCAFITSESIFVYVLFSISIQFMSSNQSSIPSEFTNNLDWNLICDQWITLKTNSTLIYSNKISTLNLMANWKHQKKFPIGKILKAIDQISKIKKKKNKKNEFPK